MVVWLSHQGPRGSASCSSLLCEGLRVIALLARNKIPPGPNVVNVTLSSSKTRVRPFALDES
jgi:hypothetical protein